MMISHIIPCWKHWNKYPPKNPYFFLLWGHPELHEIKSSALGEVQATPECQMAVITHLLHLVPLKIWHSHKPKDYNYSDKDFHLKIIML